ncbi:hypothetical protein HDU98_009046 [Podochytrium sp. JEL0797]|nr:hypothetical protein HDU98_009046 [Podochytrium sp. JEL0797]
MPPKRPANVSSPSSSSNKSRKSKFDLDDQNTLRSMVQTGQLTTTSDTLFESLAVRFNVDKQDVKQFIQNYVGKARFLAKKAAAKPDTTTAAACQASPTDQLIALGSTLNTCNVAGFVQQPTAGPSQTSVTTCLPMPIIKTVEKRITKPTMYRMYLKQKGREIRDENVALRARDPEFKPAKRAKAELFGLAKIIEEGKDERDQTEYQRMMAGETEEDRALKKKCEDMLEIAMAGYKPTEEIVLSEREVEQYKQLAFENLQQAIKEAGKYGIDFMGYWIDFQHGVGAWECSEGAGAAVGEFYHNTLGTIHPFHVFSSEARQAGVVLQKQRLQALTRKPTSGERRKAAKLAILGCLNAALDNSGFKRLPQLEWKEISTGKMAGLVMRNFPSVRKSGYDNDSWPDEDLTAIEKSLPRLKFEIDIHSFTRTSLKIVEKEGVVVQNFELE